jgi:ATP-dependent Clp protease ATP-binding subunit ClpC
MFERFTERARQVIVLAQEEARTLKHSHIGTEHLLLGLLREEEGMAARALNGLDVTTEGTRGALIHMTGTGEQAVTGQIPFTPRATKVIELALREALGLGHNYIGTEHILLGLIREFGGAAARLLRDYDLAPEAIRNEVLWLVGKPRRSVPTTITSSVSITLTKETARWLLHEMGCRRRDEVESGEVYDVLLKALDVTTEAA